MAWLRSGDTAATDPRLLRVVEHPAFDNRMRCEVWGFVHLCATVAAEHCTDYRVSIGIAAMAAGDPGRARELLAIAVFCGLMEEVADGDRHEWMIVDDTDLLHMRSAAEIERDRQRKRDTSNHALVIPVRIRDGDQCRYCRRTVEWNDRKSNRAGTYDHREGVNGATTPETLVVCCRGCNRERSDDPQADKRVPLQPAPVSPYYSPKTAQLINDSSWAEAQGIHVTATPKPSGRTGRGPGSQPAATPLAPQDQGIAHVSDLAPGIAHDSDREPDVTPQPAAPHGREQRPDHQSGHALDSTTSPGIAHDSDRPSGIAHDSDRGKTPPAPPQPAASCEGPRPSGSQPEDASTTTEEDLTEPGRSWQIPRGPKSGLVGTGRDGSGRSLVGRPDPPGEGEGSAGDGPVGGRPRGRRRGRGKRKRSG